mgnify:CR=1 FL=1
MLRTINNNRAQSVMGEYVLTFFLVVAFMTAMTLYLKRSLQGYVRDAKNQMGNVVENRAAGFYTGPVYTEYEPYYTNSMAAVSRSLGQTDRLAPSPGFTTGIFSKTFNERTDSQIKSDVLPPKLAD